MIYQIYRVLDTRTSEVCFEIAFVLQQTTRYKSNSEGNVNVSLLSVDYLSFFNHGFLQFYFGFRSQLSNLFDLPQLFKDFPFSTFVFYL